MSDPSINPDFFTQQFGDNTMPQDSDAVPADPGNQDPPPAPDPDVDSWSQDAPTVLRAVASLGHSVSLFNDQHKAMASALDSITQRLAAMTGPPLALPTNISQHASLDPRGVPKFKAPPTFDGSASKVESFINSISGAIHLSRATLPTDRDKALFLQTYLADGNASSWFTAIQKTNAALLDDFDALLVDFCSHFGDSDLAGSAQRKMSKLYQTGSCSTYAAKFRDLLPYLDLSEATKIFYFDQHLKKDVQQALIYVRPKPSKFDEYVKLCISIDNDIHSRHLDWKHGADNSSSSKASSNRSPSSRQETARASSSSSNPTPSSSSTLSPGVPMEIDAARVSRPRGPLTDEEKDRRRRLNLCLYCGGSGHSAHDCPNKKSKPAGSSSKSSGKA